MQWNINGLNLNNAWLTKECQVIINYFEECFKNLPDTNDISHSYHIDDLSAVISVLNLLFPNMLDLKKKKKRRAQIV